MSFYETPKRRLHILKAVGFLVVAGVVFAFPAIFQSQTDPLGRTYCLIIGSFFVLIAAYNAWRARVARPGQVVVLRRHAPRAQQLRYYRVVLVVTPLVFTGLTLFTAYDLRQLETGKVQSIDVLLPLAWIYDAWGYWPTVVSAPLLGLGAMALLLRRIRQLEDRGRDGAHAFTAGNHTGGT